MVDSQALEPFPRWTLTHLKTKQLGGLTLPAVIDPAVDQADTGFVERRGLSPGMELGDVGEELEEAVGARDTVSDPAEAGDEGLGGRRWVR